MQGTRLPLQKGFCATTIGASRGPPLHWRTQNEKTSVADPGGRGGGGSDLVGFLPDAPYVEPGRGGAPPEGDARIRACPGFQPLPQRVAPDRSLSALAGTGGAGVPGQA